jgi:hypothetical protein
MLRASRRLVPLFGRGGIAPTLGVAPRCLCLFTGDDALWKQIETEGAKTSTTVTMKTLVNTAVTFGLNPLVFLIKLRCLIITLIVI